MSKQFSTLSAADMRAFLAGGQKHVGTHNLSKRILHWRYCANCGLLNLKNEPTQRALRGPCTWED